MVDLAQATLTLTISKRRSLSTRADNPRLITSGNNSASARTDGHRLSLTGNRFRRFRGFKEQTYDHNAEEAMGTALSTYAHPMVI